MWRTKRRPFMSHFCHSQRVSLVRRFVRKRRPDVWRCSAHSSALSARRTIAGAAMADGTEGEGERDGEGGEGLYAGSEDCEYEYQSSQHRWVTLPLVDQEKLDGEGWSRRSRRSRRTRVPLGVQYSTVLWHLSSRSGEEPTKTNEKQIAVAQVEGVQYCMSFRLTARRRLTRMRHLFLPTIGPKPKFKPPFGVCKHVPITEPVSL